MKKLLCLTIGLVFAWGCQPKVLPPNAGVMSPGKRVILSDITAQTLNASEVPSLKSSMGKVVLLNFWASWCGPCRMEIPSLVQLNEKYREKGLVVIGLSVENTDGASPDETQRTTEALVRFVEEGKMTYAVGIASRQTIQDYKISSIPSTFLFDRQGRAAAFFLGFQDEALLASAIDKLLEEK